MTSRTRAHRSQFSRTRGLALLIVLAVLAAACGAQDVPPGAQAGADGDGDVSFSDEDVAADPAPGADDPTIDVDGEDAPQPTREQPGDSTGPAAGQQPAGQEAGETPAEGAAEAPAQTAAAPYAGEIGVDDDSITIGTIYPQSGPFAPLFEQWPKIFRAAFQEVNDAGGVHGREIRLVTGDEGESASRAQAAVRQLAPVAFGITSGIQERTTAALAEREGIPLMALLGAIVPEGLSGRLKSSFVVGTSPEYFEPRNGPSLLAARFPDQVDNVAFVYTADVYAGSEEAFLKAAPHHGVNVVHVEKLALNQSTCLNSVSNVQAKRPDIVYVHASSLEAGCFFRDARVAGFQPQWAGRLAQLTNELSGRSNNGQVGVTYLRGMSSEEGQRAARAYRKHEGEDMVDIEPNLLAWASAQMWIQWLQAIGPRPTRAGFAEAVISASPFESGLLGPQSFARGLHVGSEHTIAGEVRGGRVVITDDVWRTTYDGVELPPFYPFR